ncbi:MAG: YfhO family protein, partial [Cyclobacteriaceae bacterium]|nr:YfhO family protein [Cyclobacteriaceae bacterium]
IKGSDILPHVIAVVIFLLVTVFFFSPIFFESKSLSQPDIQQFQGGSKTLSDYRNSTGEEGLWASNMFSGMPAYLVSLKWSDGPVVWTKKIMGLFLPHPVNNILIAFLCYYILLLAFRVRPYLAITGALAFGLSSYLIIGLSAGHNARIGAIAFMPLVLAGIHLTFSGKKMLGFGVTAMALALHLRENHLQITYYLVLMVAVYGLVQLVYAFRAKQITDFFKTLGLLIPAVIIAVGTFFGQFWSITEYTRYSIRGPSELVKPNTKAQPSGLSKDYAFAYKYGVLESFVLMIPDFYGGSSMKSLVQDENSATYKALVNSGDNETANKLANYATAYWGPQDFAGGSYYAGAIVIFLFVVGILFADKKFVWWLVPLSALSLMLSWGDSFSTFNYFMFDYFPGYNKFRSVNFALVIILLAMPLLGMIGVERLLTNGVDKETKKKLLIALGTTGGFCLVLILFAGFGSFLKDSEGQLPVWFTKAMSADRRSFLRADAFRSLAFIVSIFIMLYFNVEKKVSELGFYAFLIFMITLDIAIVDRRYFSKDNFQRKRDNSYHANSAADDEILKDKSYHRVYNLQNPMAEARTSYNHHSLGGYHGAKLRRYQDLYDSCLLRETQQLYRDAQSGGLDFKKYGVINMLNAKYVKYGDEAGNIIPNPEANGAVWFVKEMVAVNSPTEELKKTGEVNTRTSAVIDNSKFNVQNFGYDSLSSIELREFKPAYLKYESQSSTNGLAVFSEIYYPKGWNAFIDGKEASLFRANYVLRAMEIPQGKHTIEFKFQPQPYTVGNKVTLASSWVALFVLLSCVGLSIKKEKGQ